MSALDNDEMLLVLQQSLTKKRVLIVDRHPPARESLRLMLAALGVTAVHGAGNSAEVIRQVKANRFDIVLSDFVLDDGRDGQQLLEELRHAHLIPLGTVYLIITSERGYTNVVSMAELAPDDYLIKPFTADQLQARLVKAIFKKHVLRRIYEQIERGALQEAIAACDRVIQQQPAYMYDALRFKGELLHTLGKTAEAEEVFRRVLEGRVVPWAKMGLATALRDRGALDEAGELAEQVLEEAPEFLSAYDFLASVHEAKGRLVDAQQVLQRAADASPHNTIRQRLVGDTAARNKDLLGAEKAYGKVIDRSRGSSLRTVDDFANLSRVLVEKGDVAASRKITADMKREWRGDKQAELAALVTESLCLDMEGSPDKAQGLVEQAIALQQEVVAEASAKGKHVSQRLAVDLAHACYATGKQEAAQKIMRQVAAENHEDPHLIGHITSVFEKTGQPDAGKALLDQVGKQIIELNNKGVMAARNGDLEGAVELLIQAAEQVPNLQFLVNAAKAIFTLLDKKGWDSELAARAQDYLQRAQRKDRKSPKVASARELYVTVANKYGIEVDAA
ncbi:tetratricopeptide repeat protein [Quatrionicoccus australiensis]|uniref:tetratricopeptide repeat protein n=1 Tax=Quatrionicoccus australiensis TaxID=138118 RepID=UPI001CF84754|nr:tetratricopeptide repeat protein [Quatrionicoccus australiensis]UCV15039.1 response regulator [Quatrionicoccus australiensis]